MGREVVDTSQVRPTEITARSFLIRGNLDDFSILDNDVHQRLCFRDFPSNDHNGFLEGFPHLPEGNDPKIICDCFPVNNRLKGNNILTMAS
jgi:hypothetical protein